MSKFTPTFTGYHDKAFDTTVSIDNSNPPPYGKVRTHAFGLQLGNSIAVEFPSTTGSTAEILMLDCEPGPVYGEGGDTFSLMEQPELQDYAYESEDDEPAFSPQIGLRAMLTLTELDAFIAGLQKVRTRLATVNEQRGFTK